MSKGPVIGALLFLVPCLALAAASSPPIPNTPAGHALAAWLDAFNRGDRARFESFEQAHAPWMSLDREMAHRERVGGYDLVSIEKGGKLWLVFRANAKATAAEVIGSLVVKPNDPDRISLLSLEPLQAKSAEITVDDAQRAHLIEGAAALLEQFYVFPDVAKRTATQLRTRQKHGDYKGITDAQVFAVRLEDDLRALTDDKHVAVDFFVKAPPPGGPEARPRADPQRIAADNCGFEKAEHYPPNIGYLKLTAFEEEAACAATAIAAMNFLANTDALIIDLRDNPGGAPRMAALLSSYLFAEATHLDDIYDRKANTTEELWTLPYLPGKKLVGRPVYVLTSHSTFSAAEQFSYDLKSLHRATLIGETTGGGAHPVAPHRIGEHFFVRVPFGRFINPITKTDWEGTGIEPDIKVPAANALDEAMKRARGEQ